LRWLIQQDGVIAIPKANSVDHLKANLEVFDFELTQLDFDIISQLPKNYRYCAPSFLSPERDV